MPQSPTRHRTSIESLNMARVRELRGREGDRGSWRSYETVFRESFERLRDAGAELGIIASNTPHMRLDGIRRGLQLPVVSILDSTAAAVVALGARHVGDDGEHRLSSHTSKQGCRGAAAVE